MSKVASQSNMHFLQPNIDIISAALDSPSCIWLLGADEIKMSVVASKGLPINFAKKASIKVNEQSIASEVLRTRKTAIIEDILKENKWKYREEMVKLGLYSAIVAPLKIKSQIVGVLDVYNLPNFTTSASEKVSIIESFAVEIASKYRQIQGLETLANVGQKISAELIDTEKLYKLIVEAIQKQFECNNVSLYTVNDSECHEVVSTKNNQDLIKVIMSKLASWVFIQGEPVIINNLKKFIQDENWSISAGRISNYSFILSPIWENNRISFVIVGYFNRIHGFDEYDQRLLSALSNQATIAIRNTNLLTKEREQSIAFSKLNKLVHELASKKGTEVKKLLTMVAESAKDVLEADIIELYEYNQDDRKIILPHISTGELLDKTVKIDKIYPDNALWEVIEAPGPLYVPYAKQSPQFTNPFTIPREGERKPRFVFRENIVSTAAIPLKIESNPVGLMFASYRTRQEFRRDQREHIELFANHAAIAIKNARLMEQAFKAESYFRNIVINCPDPIIVLDDKGKIKVFNAACEKLWGLKFDEVKDKLVSNYYMSEQHARDLGRMLWENKNNRIEYVDATIKTGEGKNIPISLSASLLFNSSGSKVGSVGVFKDMGEIKRLQNKVLETEKLITVGRLAQSVGHDLKHDIGTVLFYIEALISNKNDEQKTDLGKIYLNIKDTLWNSTNKLQNMLTATQKTDAKKNNYTLSEIFKDIDTHQYRQASSIGVEYSISHFSEDIVLYVDQELLQQVLSNLFTNSVNAIEKKRIEIEEFTAGRIIVTTKLTNYESDGTASLKLVWWDNGIGMTQDQLKDIFEPFISYQQAIHATGLGLFIVKNIIAIHDGLIEVKSKPLKETCFIITIPIERKKDT